MYLSVFLDYAASDQMMILYICRCGPSL